MFLRMNIWNPRDPNGKKQDIVNTTTEQPTREPFPPQIPTYYVYAKRRHEQAFL